MKIWTSDYVFEHGWSDVVEAAYRKYPNPLTPSVTSVDVIDRSVGTDGVLRSNRIIRSSWSIPRWVFNLVGLDNPSYAFEYSEVRPEERTMTMRTHNVSCLNHISVNETLVYKPLPEDTSNTLLQQKAEITIRGVPLAAYCEEYMARTINANATKGRQGLEWVISQLKQFKFEAIRPWAACDSTIDESLLH